MYPGVGDRVDRLSGIRPHPARATGGASPARRRSRAVPGHRAGTGASPRPGPPAVGMLDHRRPQRQPLGDLDKIHHCMAGAMSAAHLLARLCDDADGSAFANNVDIKQIPPYGDARSWAETLWRMSVSIAGAVCTAAARAVSWPAVTSPAGPVTTRRRYQAVRVPRDAVDAVCHKFGVTANDVALAAITEGFERFCCTAASNRAPTHCVPWRKPMAARPCCPISPSVRRPGAAIAHRAQPVTAERPSSTRQSVGLYASCCAPR